MVITQNTPTSITSSGLGFNLDQTKKQRYKKNMQNTLVNASFPAASATSYIPSDCFSVVRRFDGKNGVFKYEVLALTHHIDIACAILDSKCSQGLSCVIIKYTESDGFMLFEYTYHFSTPTFEDCFRHFD